MSVLIILNIYIYILGILKVCGYLRGSPLAIENIIHILGLGDFHISQIDKMPDPCGNRIAVPVVLQTNIGDTAIIRENTIQEMDSEQTWPAIEEMSSDNGNKMPHRITR